MSSQEKQKKKKCTYCSEAKSIGSPLQLRELVGLLLVTAICLYGVWWAGAFYLVRRADRLLSIIKWSYFLILLVAFAYWLRCTVIGRSLVCFIDSDGKTHLHIKTGDFDWGYREELRYLQLRIGGYFRRTYAASEYGIRMHDWRVSCWDGREEVRLCFGDDVMVVKPGEAVEIVARYRSIHDLLNMDRWHRQKLRDFAQSILVLIGQAYGNRDSQKSARAMRLRRELMMRFDALQVDCQNIVSGLKEEYLTPDLLDKWGTELMVLRHEMEDEVAVAMVRAASGRSE